MSHTRPPNRSPFQQNSRSNSTGNNQQRSPQIKKYHSSPAWGSGAVFQGPKNNGASPGHFVSQSYNLTSPPFNVTSPPYNFTSPPPHQHQQFRPSRSFTTSPRHHGTVYNKHGPQIFRTPQPMYRYPTSPQKSWSCDKNYRPSKRLNLKSPRRNPNSNPGGSNDIDLYYHPSMLDDPWQNLTPVPVTHIPAVTT